MQQTLGDSTVQSFGRCATWDDSGYAPGVYTCKMCWKVFKCQQNLDDHVNGKHLDSKRFRCRLCGKAFKWRSLLSGHRKKCALTVSSAPGLSPMSLASGSSLMSSIPGPSPMSSAPGPSPMSSQTTSHRYEPFPASSRSLNTQSEPFSASSGQSFVQ